MVKKNSKSPIHPNLHFPQWGEGGDLILAMVKLSKSPKTSKSSHSLMGEGEGFQIFTFPNVCGEGLVQSLMEA